MTISSETSKSGPYFGNGSTTVFNYQFKIVDASHLTVIKRDADGVETVLVIDADYTVSDVGEPGGGQITMVAAPANGETITILRNVPFTQETDLENQGAYYAETVEAAFDLMVMRDQQLQEQIDRAVRIPASADPSALNNLVEDIIRLSASADEIDTVANISGDVTAVAGNAANITTVANNIAGVNTVANNISDVQAVAGIAGNVNIVAGDHDEIVTLAAMTGEINAVAAIDDDVKTVAANIGDVQTVAANVVDVTNFADVYQGPKSSDPVVRNNGSALQAGDLYFNTATNQMRVYDGAEWRDASAEALNMNAKSFVGDGVETDFTLNLSPSVAENVLVWVGGVRQVPGVDYTISGATLAFLSAPSGAIDTLVIATTSMIDPDKWRVPIWYKDVADLLADDGQGPTGIGYSGSAIIVAAGDPVEAGGFPFEIAAADEADPDLTTPALVNLFIRPTQHGFVNPEQLGLIGAGGNDHPKIQRALDSGYPVVIPKGGFRVAEPLEQYAAGQRIFCAGKEDTVVYSNSVVPHDVIRLRGTHADLDGGMWRGTMSAATTREEHTAVIRVLTGLVAVHDTRTLSNTSGCGNLITLDNWDPVTGDVIPGGGRYFHNLYNNRMGNYGTGYPYAGIRAYLYEIGLHATSMRFNHIIADRAIMLGGASGAGASGGNVVMNNRCQSATGTQSVKVGNGVDIQPHGGLEIVVFNYFENYDSGILSRRTDDANGISIGCFSPNDFDNCTQNVRGLGGLRFVNQDYQQMLDWWNGWNTRYGNDSYVDFFAPGGSTSIRRVHADGAHAMQIVSSRVKQTAALTGNDQVITPTSSQIAINGGGANRTGITIANGIHEGQELTITASTWGATIDNDGGVGGNQNIYFAGNAASCVMGNSATNVAMLKLKWVSAFIGANGAWVEQGRLVRP